MNGKDLEVGHYYRAIDGPVKGEEGACVEIWQTGFGRHFLKLKTSTGIHSMRAIDVEPVGTKPGKKKKRKR